MPAHKTLRIAALGLAVSALGLTACGDDSPATSATTTAPAKPADPKDTSAKPTIEVPDGDAPAKLEVTDIVDGTGAEAVDGAFLSLDYVGVAYSNGTEFDASWDRGQTITLTLGAGSVIPGWEQGLRGMKVGGRRQLIIPPDLAYGEQGQGSIGKNETLIFVVDLRAAFTKPAVDWAQVKGGDKLQTKDLIEGSGTAIEEGDAGQFLYSGWVLGSQTEFDTSWAAAGPEPFAATLEKGALIDGWVEGAVGMKPGGRRLVVIPPDLGYGAAGAGGGAIPPNATLVFVIDLVSIS